MIESSFWWDNKLQEAEIQRYITFLFLALFTAGICQMQVFTTVTSEIKSTSKGLTPDNPNPLEFFKSDVQPIKLGLTQVLSTLSTLMLSSDGSSKKAHLQAASQNVAIY